MDVSIALDGKRVIVFKSMPDRMEDLFSNYKYIIGEYLGPVLRWMKEIGFQALFFVGSFQDSYSRYYYAYRHCRWLQEHVRQKGTAVFFYDYVGAYMRQIAPMRELTHIFYIYEKRMTEERKDSFLETFASLIHNNYNFNKAAKDLYIHKNTLVYRDTNWKELFNVNPVDNSADRSFIEFFYSYLLRNGGIEKE